MLPERGSGDNEARSGRDVVRERGSPRVRGVVEGYRNTAVAVEHSGNEGRIEVTKPPSLWSRQGFSLIALLVFMWVEGNFVAHALFFSAPVIHPTFGISSMAVLYMAEICTLVSIMMIPFFADSSLGLRGSMITGTAIGAVAFSVVGVWAMTTGATASTVDVRLTPAKVVVAIFLITGIILITEFFKFFFKVDIMITQPYTNILVLKGATTKHDTSNMRRTTGWIEAVRWIGTNSSNHYSMLSRSYGSHGRLPHGVDLFRRGLRDLGPRARFRDLRKLRSLRRVFGSAF